jgi:hypothetical protein
MKSFIMVVATMLMGLSFTMSFAQSNSGSGTVKVDSPSAETKTKDGAQVLKALIDYVNKQPRLASLSTANKEGKVDSAYFGSPRMIDEKTLIMGLGNSRTFSYLRENPYAVFLIMEPGQTVMDWKGVRLYLKMTGYETSGPKYDALKAQIAKSSGEAAARIIYALVSFEIYEMRPLADFGQGWERSITSR